MSILREDLSKPLPCPQTHAPVAPIPVRGHYSAAGRPRQGWCEFQACRVTIILSGKSSHGRWGGKHCSSREARWPVNGQPVVSLVQSAKLKGQDPWAYLRDVLARIHSHPSHRLDELLPHRWRPS
jgi:hypothetical protein